MPDDKTQPGSHPATPTHATLHEGIKLDHDHVTPDQTYEVEALMAKHKKSKKQVLDAIKKAGGLRVQIERVLRK